MDPKVVRKWRKSLPKNIDEILEGRILADSEENNKNFFPKMLKPKGSKKKGAIRTLLDKIVRMCYT